MKDCRLFIRFFNISPSATSCSFPFMEFNISESSQIGPTPCLSTATTSKTDAFLIRGCEEAWLQSASAFDLERNPLPAGVGWPARCREIGAAVIAQGLLPVRARARSVDVDPGPARPQSCAE